MALPKIRPATDADWRALFGTAVPIPATWSGVVAASDYVIYGIGAVYFAVDGRWWITCQRWSGVRMTKTAHRIAWTMIDSIMEAGLTVHALADLSIDGAELWLRRLGFTETEEQKEGARVWVLK